MTSPAATPPPAISSASYAMDVPAERPWSRIIKRGETLRIIDSEGQQAVDALLYCLDDPAERRRIHIRADNDPLAANKHNLHAAGWGCGFRRHDDWHKLN